LILKNNFLMYFYISQTIFAVLCFLTIVYLLKKTEKDRWDTQANQLQNFLRIGLTLLILFFSFRFSSEILGFNDLNNCMTNLKHHFSNKTTSQFHPRGFLEHIPVNSRIAVNAPSWMGLDLKATRDHLLSSTGRSVFLNKYFSNYLYESGLIEIDQNPAAYHFKEPYNAESLSDLGIQFVMQPKRDQQMETLGWQLLDLDRSGWAIYQSPNSVSLAYLEDNAGQRITIDQDNIILNGNSINIELPNREGELIATFVNLPGWKGSLDGREVQLNSRSDSLLSLNVHPHNRKAVFNFQPFKTIHYLLAIIFSSFIPLSVFLIKPKS